jgi:hypothetical protein
MSFIIEKYKLLIDFDENISRKLKYIYIFGHEKEVVYLVKVNNKVFTINYVKNSLQLSNLNCLFKLIRREELCFEDIVDFSNGKKYILARSKRGDIFYKINKGLNGSNGKENHFKRFVSKNCNYFFIDICSGNDHSLALTNDGKVFMLSFSIPDSQKNEEDKTIIKPITIAKSEKIKVNKIACGLDHFLALTEKGCVYSWGSNEFGQCGQPRDKSTDEPEHIELYFNDVHIFINNVCCGKNHSLLLSKEGDLYSFGNNDFGQLGKKSTEFNLKIEVEIKFIDICSHSMTDISIALSQEGVYYVWGLCGEKRIYSPESTDFSSFNDVLINYHQITIKPIYVHPDFEMKSDLNDDGKFEKDFDEFGLIGSGSFGIVYKARQKTRDEICAVKKILLNKSGINSIQREIEIISKVQSEHVVQYRSVWKENIQTDVENKPSFLYIEMEYCSHTLKEIITYLENNFFVDEYETLNIVGFYIASEICEEIFESVDFLHKQSPSIIHRDLKPTNILITTALNGKFVKLCDFGLATIHEKEQSHTEAKGTLKYMAPEVLTRKYDTKADIYSLGIIMMELFYFDLNKLV